MSSSKKTVLLVEDGQNERLLFEMAGKKAGVDFDLQKAVDGREALDYLEGRGDFCDRLRFPLPQLVVLDLNMPGMSGFEVLERIRRHATLRELPVVIWTSSTSAEDIRRAYALTVNSYLVKPPSLGLLVDMVRTIDDYWLKLNHSPSLPVLAPGSASE